MYSTSYPWERNKEYTEYTLRVLCKVQTVSINFPDPHLLLPDRDRRVVCGSLVKLLAQHLPVEAEALAQKRL